MPSSTKKIVKPNTTTKKESSCQSSTCSSVRRAASVSDDLSLAKNTWLGDELNEIEESSNEEQLEKRRKCFFADSCSLSDDDSMYESEQDSPEIPFWFSHEDPSHLESVMKAYSRHLRLDKRTLGSRQLPNFVGRVERQPVENEEDCDLGFTTMDTVVVYRRDQRQLGSTVSSIDQDKVLLTKWNEDGVPVSFITLESSRQLEIWRSRRILTADPSFIYCLPVWHNEVDFVYQVCTKKREVGYAREPFNFTKYIPQHYLPQIPTTDSSTEG